MKHDDARKALQDALGGRRAVSWFIRGEIFVLGYFDADGKRVELARGDRGESGTKRVLTAAIRAIRQEVAR